MPGSILGKPKTRNIILLPQCLRSNDINNQINQPINQPKYVNIQLYGLNENINVKDISSLDNDSQAIDNNFYNNNFWLKNIILGILLTIYIIYIFCGIIFVIYNYTYNDICKKDNIWWYIFTSLILSILRFSFQSSYVPINIIFNTICLGIIEILMIICGSIEIFNNNCGEKKFKEIWYYSLITYGIQLCFAFIFLIIIPIYYFVNIYK